MLILECPYCGVKAEETELSPGYEAHLKRYGPGSTPEEFEAYMFARKNPKGVHFERWRHVYGCGKWFLDWPKHAVRGSGEGSPNSHRSPKQCGATRTCATSPA